MWNKKIILYSLALLTAGPMKAQTPYPSPPAASGNIVRMEYFFDTDPGLGNGTPLPITPAPDLAGLVATVTLSGSGLEKRIHRLYIRSQDENGHWSHTAYSQFDNIEVPAYPTPGALSSITALEYFIDTDPGIGKGTAVPVTPATDINALNIVVNTTGLTQGIHRVYVRAKDASDVWSLTNYGIFNNISAPNYPSAAAVPNITEMEYFIDTDPGFGKGIKLPVPAATDINAASYLVNVSGLPAGVHRLYVRSKDALDRWSLTNIAIFENTLAAPYPSAPPPAPPIGELEYFIDTDPGFGNATAVAITSSSDISDLSINVPVTGLSDGKHTIYVRSRQNPWSLTYYADFLVDATPLPLTWMYVKGLLQNGNSQIQWGTTNEVNVDHFEVEHSQDGLTFQVIGKLQAADNGQTNHYTFTHQRPLSGFNYYRVRQVDRDGQSTYSKVVTLLHKAGIQGPVLGPNPATNTVSLFHFGDTTPDIRSLEVYDASGRRVLTQSIQQNNDNVITLGVSQLKPGVYTLKVNYDKGAKSLPFIKN